MHVQSWAEEFHQAKKIRRRNSKHGGQGAHSP
jgi:hypothetical protein